MILDSYSRKSVKTDVVKPYHLQYKTISHNPKLNVSLLEIQVGSNQNHFLRAFSSHLSCPVLGDEMYGGRARKVNNVYMQVPLQSQMAHNPQVTTS